MPTKNPLPRHYQNKNAYTHKLAERDRGERRMDYGIKHSSWFRVALAVFALAAFVGLILLVGRLIGG